MKKKFATLKFWGALILAHDWTRAKKMGGCTWDGTLLAVQIPGSEEWPKGPPKGSRANGLIKIACHREGTVNPHPLSRFGSKFSRPRKWVVHLTGNEIIFPTLKESWRQGIKERVNIRKLNQFWWLIWTPSLAPWPRVPWGAFYTHHCPHHLSGDFEIPAKKVLTSHRTSTTSMITSCFFPYGILIRSKSL